MRLRELKGLGSKSEKCLHEIGIRSKEDLESIGAVRAFIKLKKMQYQTKFKLSLCHGWCLRKRASKGAE